MDGCDADGRIDLAVHHSSGADATLAGLPARLLVSRRSSGIPKATSTHITHRH